MCCQLSGLDGSTNESDVIADLAVIPLKKAHQKMIDTAAKIIKARIRGSTAKKSPFPCDFCLHYFKKTSWMKKNKGEKNVKKAQRYNQPASR